MRIIFRFIGKGRSPQEAHLHMRCPLSYTWSKSSLVGLSSVPRFRRASTASAKSATGSRIMHHEPILFNGRLQKYVHQIFDTISWMSPMTARWVRGNSSFDERFASYRTVSPLISGG